MNPRRHVCLAVHLSLCVLASTSTLAAPPDPLDARAATQPLSHRSVFDGYRRLGDASAVPWREANDTVKRIGGWRSYAREAAQTPAAAPAPDARPASAPSAGTPAASPPAAPPAAAPGHRH